MNARFWISGLVLTIASGLAGFLIHGVLLHADYAALGPIMRSDEDSAKYMSMIDDAEKNKSASTN